MAQGPHQNADFIRVGQETILVLQVPGIKQKELLGYMEIFLKAHHLQDVVKKDLPWTLKLHIPGLCGVDEIAYSTLWAGKPVPFYRMSDRVLKLYEEGWIDNDVFCNHVSRVAPSHFTEELIRHIWQAQGDGDAIRKLVKPYKAS